MNNKYSVLIVEDDSNISSFMSTILTANNYNVRIAKNGSEALMMVSSYCPDVVILDLGLPDMDGKKVIKTVRQWSHVPIIVVSARTREIEKIEALDLGADDYVTKPFGTGELLARIRTAIRHLRNSSLSSYVAQSGIFKASDLVVDYDKRHVYVSGRDVHLTQTEYNLVAILSKYAGKVLTYDFLIKNIWGPNVSTDNQILRVNMANIRRKIEENPAEPKYIFTEISVGYRMIEND